jgi:hypothetical protein
VVLAAFWPLVNKKLKARRAAVEKDEDPVGAAK